jgi:hypothetical protein
MLKRQIDNSSNQTEEENRARVTTVPRNLKETTDISLQFAIFYFLNSETKNTGYF